MWTEPGALAELERKEKERRDMAKLLILYLKQMDLLNLSIEKTNITEVAENIKECNVNLGEEPGYNVTFNHTVSVGGTNYFSMIRGVRHYDKPIEGDILRDSQMTEYEFENMLNSDENFLIAIMKINKITPLGLARNAEEINLNKRELNDLIEKRRRLLNKSQSYSSGYENEDTSSKGNMSL